MVYSVAQARRHLEQKYQEIAKATLETTQRYLDDKGKEIVAEMDACIKRDWSKLHPGWVGRALVVDYDRKIDAYEGDRVEEEIPPGTRVQTVKIGDVPLMNATVRSGETYDAYFLLRKRAKAEAKPS